MLIFEVPALCPANAILISPLRLKIVPNAQPKSMVIAEMASYANAVSSLAAHHATRPLSCHRHGRRGGDVDVLLFHRHGSSPLDVRRSSVQSAHRLAH